MMIYYDIVYVDKSIWLTVSFGKWSEERISEVLR